MAGFLALQIIALALGVVQSAAQEINSTKANEIRSKYSDEIKALTQSINADTMLLNQLQDAYNNNNTKLFTKLANASPVGAGYAHLKDLIERKRQEYNKESRTIADRISEKQSLVDEASRTSDRASYSIADNIHAHKQYDQIRDKTTTITNQEQNILGGLKDA